MEGPQSLMETGEFVMPNKEPIGPINGPLPGSELPGIGSIAPMRRLTEMYSPAQLAAALVRARARADRSGVRFALLFARPEGKKVRKSKLLRLARTLMQCVRLTDEVGFYTPEMVCAILPDTDIAGAQRLSDRLKGACASRGIIADCMISQYPSDAPPYDNDEARVDADAKGERRGNPAASNGHAANATNGHAARNRDAARSGESQTAMRLANCDLPEPDAQDNGERRPTCLADRSAELLLEEAMKRGHDPVVASESLFVRPRRWYERAFEVTAVSFALLLASPIMVAMALAIKLTSSGPILFKQWRRGIGGKPFQILKFRTMVVNAEALQEKLRQQSEQDGPAFKMKRDPRVTLVGAFLRKTSLDELPQLINVLMGDMSLVGPRPLPIHEQDECERWHQSRLDVNPGITCIWQVYGRSRVSFEEWMRMDLGYINRRRSLTDLALLLKTIPAVLLRRGAH